MKKNIITSIAVSAALLTLCACGESSTVTQSSYDPASVADTQTFIDKIVENMDWKRL